MSRHFSIWLLISPAPFAVCFRFCGYGFLLNTTPKEHALFSERNGLRRARYLGCFRWEWLS